VHHAVGVNVAANYVSEFIHAANVRFNRTRVLTKDIAADVGAGTAKWAEAPTLEPHLRR